MEHELAGFLFPNDQHPHWSLMIVIYPYITGLVAGAFIVSSTYHVFRVEALKPVAKFSLIFAFAFFAFATAPLLNHLGHPERALNMLFTPNFVGPSMMAGFGYIYLTYGVLLIFEILFMYRLPMIEMLEDPKVPTWRKLIYKVLTLGSRDKSHKAAHTDHKVAIFLGALGIPLASMLHGYVGFIFGGVKAVAWWFTPLMPVIFLLSASVSGIAGILLFYVVIKKFQKKYVDMSTVRTLIKLLWAFLIFDFVLEMLEVAVHAYGGDEHWHHIHGLLFGPLANTFWFWQVAILTAIPFVVLGLLNLVKLNDRITTCLGTLMSFFLIFQVLFMRWNVVIGGQMMAKSERGFQTYHPEWLEKEGILVTIVILLAPIVLLWILGKIFPMWNDEDEAKALENQKKEQALNMTEDQSEFIRKQKALNELQTELSSKQEALKFSKEQKELIPKI
jgi:Ni/Fe-hydrogenase subunit HybB-like protein